MKKIIICVIFFISCEIGVLSVAEGQTVLLEQDVNADTIPELVGPNLKHFSHLYVGYGFVLGADAVGSEIRYGSSSDFVYGYRYKRKLSEFYAVGFDIFYHSTAFHLKQDSTKALPNNILHDDKGEKEKLTFHNLSLGLYNRFNFGKRGNYLGHFLDLGARIDWAFSVVHFTKDIYDIANVNNGGVVKTKTTGLVYIKPIYYNVFTRLGFNKFVITASYRLSDLFKEEYDLYPELPLLIVGVEIGLHK